MGATVDAWLGAWLVTTACATAGGNGCSDGGARAPARSIGWRPRLPATLTCRSRGRAPRRSKCNHVRSRATPVQTVCRSFTCDCVVHPCQLPPLARSVQVGPRRATTPALAPPGCSPPVEQGKVMAATSRGEATPPRPPLPKASCRQRTQRRGDHPPPRRQLART